MGLAIEFDGMLMIKSFERNLHFLFIVKTYHKQNRRRRRTLNKIVHQFAFTKLTIHQNR